MFLGRVGEKHAVIIISSVGAAPAGPCVTITRLPDDCTTFGDLAFLLSCRQGPDADGHRQVLAGLVLGHGCGVLCGRRGALLLRRFLASAVELAAACKRPKTSVCAWLVRS